MVFLWHKQKFSESPPIKRWSLYTFFLNLGRLVTAPTSGVQQEWYYVTSGARLQKAIQLWPSSEYILWSHGRGSIPVRLLWGKDHKEAFSLTVSGIFVRILTDGSNLNVVCSGTTALSSRNFCYYSSLMSPELETQVSWRERTYPCCTFFKFFTYKNL